jgi:hypothetical protein
VFGPIGLVAGAVVGYTAGPSISQGLRRGEPRPPRRSSSYEARASAGDPQSAPSESGPRATTPQAAAPTRAAAPRTASSAPPVQPLE